MSTETSAEVTETEPTATMTTEPPATETEREETEPVVTSTEPTTETRLPDDHPLVKTLAAQKEELKQLRAASVQATELTTKVAELTTKAETAGAVQAKYDRLEAFLSGLGGPISKALDSKTFSKALFESDTDIKTLITQWRRDNPTATSAALGSGHGNTESTADMNAILRAAAR